MVDEVQARISASNAKEGVYKAQRRENRDALTKYYTENTYKARHKKTSALSKKIKNNRSSTARQVNTANHTYQASMLLRILRAIRVSGRRDITGPRDRIVGRRIAFNVPL